MAEAAAYDASDQAAVDNQAKEAARRDARDRETIRIWMNHPHGRDLLYRMVYEWCHLGETFTATDEIGRSDPLRTYLHVGERNIGARLDQALRVDAESYVLMLKEQQTLEELRRARLEKQQKAEDGGQSED